MSAVSKVSGALNFLKPRLGLRAVIPAMFICTLAVGCSDSGRVPVYPVRGQILLNGKPLSEAIVTFHPRDAAAKESLPSAHTDAEGRFALTSYELGDGAPAGAYEISLVCFRARPLRKGGDSDAQNIVPSRYANAATSKLTATIVASDNDLQPLLVKTP